MTMNRRSFITALGASAAALAMPGWAQAQSGKTLKLILSVPPGAALDASARLLVEKLRVSLDRTVIIDYKVGGIGLSGGRGGVLNVIIGTLLIGTMLNGMTIMDISYAGQNLIKGVVLLLAVITDSFLNPRNEETAQQGDI